MRQKGNMGQLSAMNAQSRRISGNSATDDLQTAKRRLQAACRVSVAAIALLSGGTAAFAQTAPATTQSAQASDQSIQEVVVTGSAIKRTDNETAAPLTVLSAEDLQKKGIINVADAVRSVSADNSGTIPTAFGNGFAAGSSGVALRGLTVNSTLVLVDGLRNANYPLADDGERGFVDLNSIPMGALDHVDVYKDGASSIYGADAIAGVVNIVMKPTFEGLEATVEGGDSQHGGGEQGHVNILVGTGDLATDRYNVYFDLEAETDNKIGVDQRGYPFNTEDTSKSGGYPLTSPVSTVGAVAPSGPLTGGSILTGVQDGHYHPLGPCTGGTKLLANAPLGGAYCVQNFASYGDDQPQQDRFGGMARFTTKLGDDATAYLMTSFFQNKVYIDGAPASIQAGTPNNTNNIVLPVTLTDGAIDPYDPFATRKHPKAALISYAFGDIPANSIESNHVLREVLGVNGTAYGWDYTGAININHEYLDSTSNGYLNYPALINVIDNGLYNFYNPSKTTGSVLSELAPQVKKTSTTDLDSVEASATRSIYDLPAGPLQFAFGAGARYEYTNDPNINPNDETQGLGLATTSGDRFVYDSFLEFRAPIITNMSLGLSGRYDHYSDFGDAFSPKADLTYKPIEELLFRTSFAQGFRAPSFSESGSSVSEGFITYVPPQSFINQHLTKAGVADPYVNPYSLGLETLANQNVQPEHSTSYTFGTVIEPITGYSLSVDYYNIKINGLIQQQDPTAALNAYFAGQPTPAGYTIVLDNPDPLNPKSKARPLIVGAPYTNASWKKTDGIDFDLRGKIELPYDITYNGLLSFTDILNYKVRQPDGSSVSYLGYQSPYILSSGAGTPQYRGNLTNSFDYGPANVTLTWNYVSGIKEIATDAIGSTACLETGPTGNPFPYGCSTKPFQTIDLTASYQISDSLSIYGAILNLLDKSPPFDPLDYAGVNYNPTYAQSGIVGRFFRLGMTYKIGAPTKPLPVAPAVAPTPVAPPPPPPPAAKPEAQREFQVFFDFDKSNITEAAASVIKAAADVVKSGGVAHVTVTGHTDTVGSAKYNQALSERRAAAVKATMVSDGVDGGEITTVGVGKTGLLVPTADGVREPQNRRAVIDLQ
jgi:iron complex outermembrane receptor protein